MKRRCAISRCCELGLTMSNNASEVPSHRKRRKKSKEASPSWSGLCSLLDAVVVSCLAKVSRLDHAALAIASKNHRSLVASPELCHLRRRIGCTEASLYVCLRIFPDPIP
ncbi:unnamed protein product [Arabidopsis halleri]